MRELVSFRVDSIAFRHGKGLTCSSKFSLIMQIDIVVLLHVAELFSQEQFFSFHQPSRSKVTTRRMPAQATLSGPSPGEDTTGVSLAVVDSSSSAFWQGGLWACPSRRCCRGLRSHSRLQIRRVKSERSDRVIYMMYLFSEGRKCVMRQGYSRSRNLLVYALKGLNLPHRCFECMRISNCLVGDGC